ncbi:MAG: HD domain-containing protein [Clostridiales bacterium]|nr:HD domain-containing protein [Candidatus Blautia equi]
MENMMCEMSFQEKVQAALDRMGAGVFDYDRSVEEQYKAKYQAVKNHAEERELLHVLLALPLVRGIMSQTMDTVKSPADKNRYLAYFQHCLSVAQMLIDLNFNLTKQEEDIALAAAICHILPENETSVNFDNLEDKLTGEYGFDENVAKIVRLITRANGMSEVETRVFYQNIQQNKLALVLRLADRGNLVERLYGISSWTAHEYIYETRTYFFPMCIYAKEHYPEISGQIGVLMEKMRCHIEVSEILLSRYETREQQLSQEILFLKEENSRIRGIIKKLQAQE